MLGNSSKLDFLAWYVLQLNSGNAKVHDKQSHLILKCLGICSKFIYVFLEINDKYRWRSVHNFSYTIILN